jgi:arginase
MLGSLGVARLRISVIGVPADLGAARRGTDMGPSAIRNARLHDALTTLGHEVEDLGNLHVPVAESRAVEGERMKYLPEILAFCQELADQVARVLRAGRLPLVLGGDHSLAIGTLAGVAQVRPDTGLIWLDAHGDFNTPETTPSGNVHGMPLAVATGRGDPALCRLAGPAPKVPDHRAVLVAVRDLDPGERAALRASQLTVFTMKEIDQQGMGRVMAEAIRIASDGGRVPIHLSFDLDAVDPQFAPGVGTPVTGGLTYREAHLALELLADSGLLGSCEFVEVNPILDQGNQTARMAVELAASALGKRIL